MTPQGTAGEHSEQAPARTPDRRRRRLTRWAVHFALLWGVLCLVTLPTSLDTVGFWAGAAGIAATAGGFVHSLGEVRFRPRARWLLRGARLPVAVLADTWLVTVALARRLARRDAGDSRFEGVDLPAAEEDETAPARRALAELSSSVAPNVVSLGVDREEEVLVVHQLVPREGIAEQADPLGLR